MNYMSFDHELDFVEGKNIALVSYDGLVSIAAEDSAEKFTPQELSSARQYAEFHLKRMGVKFLGCTF